MARVYVIELERRAGRRRDSRIPWVYVGSSARDPEIRFAQHQPRLQVVGVGQALRTAPAPRPLRRPGAAEGGGRAREAELQRARELAACGFVAHSDGTSYGKGEGGWIEWGADRLALVGDHVDRAVTELADSSFEALTPSRCAELLHGERGFWVADFIDEADPPPAYGRFAHVALDALTERAAATIGVSAPAV